MVWRPRADHGRKHGTGDAVLTRGAPDGPLRKHYFGRLDGAWRGKVAPCVEVPVGGGHGLGCWRLAGEAGALARVVPRRPQASRAPGHVSALRGGPDRPWRAQER